MTISSPFFSVIIPLYNREKSIARAIESVLNQCFKDFELIIIDDCSTDNSAYIVHEYFQKDDRITYFKNEKNVERCISRNKGIIESKGKYICFLDSDDYHLPFHLEEFYNKIIKEDFPKAFLFTSAYNETEDGIRTKRVCPELGNKDLFHYFLNYTVNPQRWCLEKSLAMEILFDPEVTICEDLDFSLRLVARGYYVIQLPIETTVYVASKDSFTHGDSQKWEKELFYLQLIFSKKELKKKLPNTDKRRLMSMCYYHLASKSNRLNKKARTIYLSLRSIFLYPKGYKKGILKDLLILILVSLPCVTKIKKIILSK